MVGNARHKRMKTNPLPVIALGSFSPLFSFTSRSNRRDEKSPSSTRTRARRRAQGRVAQPLGFSAQGSSSRCTTVDRASLSAQVL
jgi:hypothetical protein